MVYDPERRALVVSALVVLTPVERPDRPAAPAREQAGEQAVEQAEVQEGVRHEDERKVQVSEILQSRIKASSGESREGEREFREKENIADRMSPEVMRLCQHNE